MTYSTKTLTYSVKFSNPVKKAEYVSVFVGYDIAKKITTFYNVGKYLLEVIL